MSSGDDKHGELVASLRSYAKFLESGGMQNGRDHCLAAASALEAIRTDPGTEKLLRDMLDRAYKMMLQAGYRVAVVDSDNNDPIIAWMSDARAVLYGSGPQPDLARLT